MRNESPGDVLLGQVFDVPLTLEYEFDGRWQLASERCDHAFLVAPPLRLAPGEGVEASPESDPAAGWADRRGHWRWSVPVWREDGTWERVVLADWASVGAREVGPPTDFALSSDPRVKLRVTRVRSEPVERAGQLQPRFMFECAIVNDSALDLHWAPPALTIWCEEEGRWLRHDIPRRDGAEEFLAAGATRLMTAHSYGAGCLRVSLEFRSGNGSGFAVSEPFVIEHAGGIGRRVVRADAAAAAAEPPR